MRERDRQFVKAEKENSPKKRKKYGQTDKEKQ